MVGWGAEGARGCTQNGTVEARGVDLSLIHFSQRSLLRGKKLDEQTNALLQPLFMVSCCHCENIIIS